MSGLTTGPGGQPGTPLQPWPAPPADSQVPGQDERSRGHWVRASLGDLSVVAAWFVVAALLGAVVWWQITPLAEYTRTKTNGELDEQQLAKQVYSDGWYFVVAVVGGLLSGVILLWWRSRDVLLMVVLVALGGALATWVMLTVGQALGPGDPSKALGIAAVGAKVPLQLKIEATGLWATWSVTALVGAIGVIWGTERR